MHEDLSDKSEEQMKLIANEDLLHSKGFLLFVVAEDGNTVGYTTYCKKIDEVSKMALLAYAEKYCQKAFDHYVKRDLDED